MLQPSDSRNFGRTLAGVGLILGPLLFLLATLVSPAWAEDTADYLNDVAGNEGAHVASALLFLLGAFLLIAGLLGLIRLLRGRGVTLGQLGAAMILIGVITSTGFVALSTIEAEAVDPNADRAQMVALLERAEEGAGGVVFFALFLGGIVLGSIVLAVGLLRNRVVPIWVPIALVASTVVSFIGGESQLASVVSFVLLAAALIPLGLKILSLSDDDWGRWVPLEGRAGAERPPAAPSAGRG